jgi:hypothetical protein
MGVGRRLAGSACVAGVVYAVVLRPRMVRWGASDDEVARSFPGEELVPDGTRAATMAITIEAPPSEVWPWLVQMGWGRAGWYSWDRLDNGGRPSAHELHSEWQDLSVGDHLAAWSPGGAVNAWEVAALEPERFLGLRGLSDLRLRVLDPSRPRPPTYTEGLWGFLLVELPGDSTRLIVSGYQTFRPRWLEGFLDFWVYPPLHWPMQVRQFANIKRNVENSRSAGTITHPADKVEHQKP